MMNQRLPRSRTIKSPNRKPQTFLVRMDLGDAMRQYAISKGFTLASCVDAAFAQFLAKNG